MLTLAGRLARIGHHLEAIDGQMAAAGMALMGGVPEAQRALESLEAQRLLLERRYDELETQMRRPEPPRSLTRCSSSMPTT
jgi:hypothetical protein